MIKNYIKIAFRNLWKHRSYSLINIFGMAFSMSISIILIMLLADQKSVDGYNPAKNRIYRITTERLNSDDLFNRFATAPLPLGERIASEYTGADDVVRIRDGFGNDWIGIDNDVNIPISGFFVDPEFLSLFHYKLKAGNPEEALNNPNSVVLKEKAAERLFGDLDPIGETIKVGNLGEYIVTGIIEENDEKSHIKFDVLASIEALDRLEDQDSVMFRTKNNWENSTSGFVYLSLKEGESPAALERYMLNVNDEIYGENEDIEWGFGLQGLTEITPGPLMSNEIGPTLPMVFVYFMGGLALIIVVSSAFNYTNLSIARALTRAREVGIRKVSGAKKPQLVAQFLTEAVVLSLLALTFSYVLLLFLKPAFLQLNFSQFLHWDLKDNWTVHVIIFVFAVGVGIISGLFPAFVLSSFQPIKVLKDLNNIRLLSRVGLRKILIVSQFSLSLIFIISVILVYKQFNLIMNSETGFRTEGVVNVNLTDEVDFISFKEKLSTESSILDITGSSHMPGIGTYKSRPVFKELDGSEPLLLDYFAIDENYVSMMELTILAGQNLNPVLDKNRETKEILINEKAVAKLGFDSPIDAVDQVVYAVDSSMWKIQGVVKNYHYGTVMGEIKGLILRNEPKEIQLVHMLVGGDEENWKGSIQTAFQEVSGDNFKAEITYLRDDIKFFHDLIFGDLVDIVTLVTILSLVISSLGLLGIATYTIETKQKEVSIRKVLGASDNQIILQLSKGFLIMLLIAIVVSVPLASLINNLWLQQIAFRVSINVGVIISGIGILLAVGLLTVFSQTWRAGNVAPIKYLRNE